MQFYVLRKPEASSTEDKLAGTEALTTEDANLGDAPRCPACGNFTGMRVWLPPFQVELESLGREFGDFVFGAGTDLIVSERFKGIYERNGLAGITSFDPVQVVKVRRRRKTVGDPPRYFKANVIRSRAAIDKVASGYEWKEGQPDLCDLCRLARQNFTFLRFDSTVLEPGTWSGEDIFRARGSSDLLTTPGFKKVCEQHDVKNAVFVAAEGFGQDFYPSPTKRLEQVFRRWQDKDLSDAERRSDYRVLAKAVYGPDAHIPEGKFHPDEDIDPDVIDKIRERIRAELGAGR